MIVNVERIRYLKPCPFCESKLLWYDVRDSCLVIFCQQCEATGPIPSNEALDQAHFDKLCELWDARGKQTRGDNEPR